MVNCWC